MYSAKISVARQTFAEKRFEPIERDRHEQKVVWLVDMNNGCCVRWDDNTMVLEWTYLKRPGTDIGPT